MVEKVRPHEPEPLKLPRRLAGNVYLNRGYVSGLNSFALADEPVSVVCNNDTLGAIQIKMMSPNVSVIYEWVYGDNESWGKASLSRQDIFIDMDIEKVSVVYNTFLNRLL